MNAYDDAYAVLVHNVAAHFHIILFCVGKRGVGGSRHYDGETKLFELILEKERHGEVDTVLLHACDASYGSAVLTAVSCVYNDCF